ncbi:hypothetical protein SAMN05216548_10183 [Faunimonas pinastri]|uniref:Uncharacterized protein n=1 Tax=Faunimonas pinastri TaxID=1855383 RepID=A0A1H8Z9F6_9HYPH|nr:hypothetical protein [Faunimonas pinastri]SEP61070.1 hypothetical protein SAMN05216548_10183 [Faunimonas pinastri]
MIQSAMMFALGAFVCGLLALGLGVAFARRARRLTERRLLAAFASRRSEFAVERDEMRVRHAVQIRRMEQEIDRLLEWASGQRSRSETRASDAFALRAELSERDRTIRQLQDSLGGTEERLKHAETRLGETREALRKAETRLRSLPARHAAPLQQPTSEEQPVKAEAELAASARSSRAHGAARMSAFTDPASAFSPTAPNEIRISDVPAAASMAPQQGGLAVEFPSSRSDTESPENGTAVIHRIAEELRRISGEAEGTFGRRIWRAPATPAQGETVPEAAAGPVPPTEPVGPKVIEIAPGEIRRSKTGPAA